MAISLKTDTIIDALRQAPALLGQGRNGKPPHKSFMVRAIKQGIRGHKLEALRVGSRWVTSVEALQDWVEAQTRDPAPKPAASPSACHKAAERAARELDRLGF